MRRQTDRCDWIDCAKGITILMVIIGHTVGGVIREAIFSFHMPLFFILSCATFKYSKDKSDFVQKTERAFMHLIIPAIVIYFIRCIIFITKNYTLFLSIDYVKTYLQNFILTAVFASGVSVQIIESQVEAIGMPWFLVALFEGRALFDYLHLKMNKNKLIVTCISISIIGLCLGKIQWLPLSADIIMAIMPVFYIGSIFLRFDIKHKSKSKFVLYSFSWAVLLSLSTILTHSYMELACRRYTLFPICYVIALLGTLMVSEFCVIICKSRVAKPIVYLGKNSLYMFCIHMLDNQLLTLWEITDNEYLNAVCRIVLDSFAFIAVMFFIYKINKRKSKHKN